MVLYAGQLIYIIERKLHGTLKQYFTNERSQSVKYCFKTGESKCIIILSSIYLGPVYKQVRPATTSGPYFPVRPSHSVSILDSGQTPYFTRAKPKLNQLDLSEVRRRLTQLNSSDFILSGWGVLHAWQAENNAWRPTLGQTQIFTWCQTKHFIKSSTFDSNRRYLSRPNCH